ncbi:MAG TPA: DUF4410 domain-containing protein [Myxococcota bacterium]|nr:DUF4410 domain-containing protein [Myxococcota bacterium]
MSRKESRRRIARSLTLLAASFSLGCSIDAPIYSAPVPEPVRAVVVVEPNRAALEYEGPTDFDALFAEYLAGALQELGIAAVVASRNSSAESPAPVVVTAQLFAVDPGSWNLRFWIGYGAGRASIRASITAIGAPDEPPLFYKLYVARSITWQFEENILRRVLAKIARAAALDLAPRLGSSR